MAVPLLATKLYIPPPGSKIVLRPRLIKRLNGGLVTGRASGVTLISAPAGFGKTTLVSEWIASCGRPAAWLSLDEGDNDPARFLNYFVAALRTIAPNIGADVPYALQSPQPPSPETILTALLNEIITIPENFILVLDDYHVIGAKPVEQAFAFLVEHLPPQMHLLITTREDPALPLARLRARGQLTELRAADLRFTLPEAAEFLNHVMGLQLSPENIAALETRTEGWIAGLQLAALSMQGHQDSASFIQSFTGSHHFVMDYLVEEVLKLQPENIQSFLLRTSILERLCGPLCDAVLLDPSTPGQETLEYLERANLFIIPLDNERRWYRYHHLFADLLRQRLDQNIAPSASEAQDRLNELHIRASQWFEEKGFHLEAFQHAAAAHDIDRAERLSVGDGIPLHFSGGVTPILEWLDSLPTDVLNARPTLWWRHAALLLINGQTIGVGEKLQAAEAALDAILQGREPDEKTRNLIGQIATARATLALTRYDTEGMLSQSRRALEFLDADHLFNRASVNWTMGFAYLLLGDRVAARNSFTESIALSQKAGAIFTTILATIGLGQVQELDNELYQAAETYRYIVQLAGDKPQQIIGEAHIGLARILYEWNDLESAEQHARQSLHLSRQYESVIDRFVIGEVFLSRLKLAQGDATEAAKILANVDQAVRQNNFVHRMPDVAAAQVITFLRQGTLSAAAHLAQTYNLPMSLARVHLAQGDSSASLAVLESWRQYVEAKGWKDEQLKAMVLQAVVLQAHAEKDQAVRVLAAALRLAEPEGFVRLFVDEGEPMAQLLSEAAAQGIMPDYAEKLLGAFEAETLKNNADSSPLRDQPLLEPLSPRELEVLRLIAQGLSNDEISKRLFLALDTVKGHNRRIYDKLQVQRRTEAVARARELGLL
ncbi:MAG TPA: LuxR C-terminal-related transcriptional regulator [Anaerolineales bacterium]|nr:LuxR C-terminal-related transcriptional regulator [Anaerolineales bacterium]